LTLWKQNENENNEREETEDPKNEIAEKNIHEHEQVNEQTRTEEHWGYLPDQSDGASSRNKQWYWRWR